jgi:hypothetical protein
VGQKEGEEVSILNGELDDSNYTEQELDNLNHWIPLTHGQLPDWPFRLYFVKLKSGSDEARELFEDPKAAMLEGAGALPALAEQDDALNGDTKVTTTIFGHDRTLKLRLILAVAAVDTTDHSVSMTSYKSVSLPSDS